ncbi:hypothetical protein C8R43DRAFT_945460 [Mycena crocata]|nr:hypothetical protein C8R43DRAFT_945460 [Mycena crocata]
MYGVEEAEEWAGETVTELRTTCSGVLQERTADSDKEGDQREVLDCYWKVVGKTPEGKMRKEKCKKCVESTYPLIITPLVVWSEVSVALSGDSKKALVTDWAELVCQLQSKEHAEGERRTEDISREEL